MADMQARFPGRIIRVGLTSHRAAHLAGKTIPIKHICTDFLRNTTCERWYGLQIHQQILARFQFTPVIVRDNIHALFIAQFTHPAAPFASSRYLPQCIRVNNLPHVLVEELA